MQTLNMRNHLFLTSKQAFGYAFFFAESDPGKNLNADPDPGGIRGRGLGVKEKNEFFLVFFTFQMILNNFTKN